MTEEEIEELKSSLPSIPPETCSLIDKVIRGIQSALRLCHPRGSFRYRTDPTTQRELADAIETELDGLEDLLEIVRQHNQTLRELGAEWYQFAKHHTEETEKVEQL